jgi:hypothetical protein
MIKRKRWAIDLVIGLAFFDIIGEFVAQGTIVILITVSFLVATLLLILAFLYRRQFKGLAQVVRGGMFLGLSMTFL